MLDWGTELWAVEIKLTSNPGTEDTDRLNKTADMIGASRRILLTRIARPFGNDQLLVTNPKHWFSDPMAIN